jgi:chromosome segregation ATPase
MDRETVEELKRHFGLVAEQVRSDVRAVAEGQQDLRRQVSEIRVDLVRESEETRALIRLSYGEIDRRVRGLEGELADLRARVERLEERREA